MRSQRVGYDWATEQQQRFWHYLMISLPNRLPLLDSLNSLSISFQTDFSYSILWTRWVYPCFTVFSLAVHFYVQCSLTDCSYLAFYYLSLSCNVTHMERHFLITFWKDFSLFIYFFYLLLNSMYYHGKLSYQVIYFYIIPLWLKYNLHVRCISLVHHSLLTHWDI